MMMEKQQITLFRQKKLSCCLAFVLIWTLHSTLDYRNTLIAFKRQRPNGRFFQSEKTQQQQQLLDGDELLSQPIVSLSTTSWLFSSSSTTFSNTSTTPYLNIEASNTTITTKTREKTWQNHTSTRYDNVQQRLHHGEKTHYDNDNNYNNNILNKTLIIIKTEEKQEGNNSLQHSSTNKVKTRIRSQKEKYKNLKRQEEKEIQYKLKSLVTTTELEMEDPSILPFTSCGKLNFTAPIVCGRRKCFVKVKNESNIGYLIASLSFSSLYRMMINGYNYTKYLEDTYKIKHFSLTKPTKIPIILPCIQRHLEEERRYYFNVQSKFKQGFHSNYGLIIQKSLIAPTPHIIIAQANDKKEYYYSILESFIMNHVPNTQQFVNRLNVEINHTLLLLQKEPCLLGDFQVLVDIYGNLYHIDIDRCFENHKFHEPIDDIIHQINTTLQATIIQATRSI